MKIVTDFVEKKDKSSDIKKSGSSNRLCSISGGNHNVLVIGLENGGYIITEHFFKEGQVKIKVNFNVKRKSSTLDFINLFWKRESERGAV